MSEPSPSGLVVMGAVQLRTSLVWHGEVMADHVLTTPAAITLGATGRATFVIPDLSLPPNFAVIRPGNLG